MRRAGTAALVLAAMMAGAFAQAPPASSAAASEDEELRQALTESSNSPQGMIRVLEAFLTKHPATAQRPDIEKILLKSAMDTKDVERIARYGEDVLSREPTNFAALENTTVAELKLGGEKNGERALGHAEEFERLIEQVTAAPQKGRDEARRQLERDRGLSRAYLFEARAHGVLGHVDRAAALAKKSYESYPNAESAREAGWWLDQLHQPAEAVNYLAEAFIMPDGAASGAERAGDRERLAAVYQSWKGSEAGLGDFVMAAYDRVMAAISARRLALKQYDPNVQASDPMQFTLSALDGSPLSMASLKGKVIVMDFWATWCGPCRTQHPIYEKVKERFRERPDVVFLAIDTDEDRSAVDGFLRAQGWSRNVYFEDGLAAVLKVSSLPTTIIIDKQGKVSERMTGFLPDRFGDQLSNSIQTLLGTATQGKSDGHGG